MMLASKERLITAVSDALEDLGEKSNVPVAKLVKGNQVPRIVQTVLHELTSQQGSISTWSELLEINDSQFSFPAWLTSQAKVPITEEIKLELMFYLLTSLQQQRLLKSSEDGITKEHTTINGSEKTEALLETKNNGPLHDGSVVGDCAAVDDLKKKLSPSQLALVDEYHSLLQADYDRRKQGMHMRLEILQTNWNFPSGTSREEESSAAVTPELETTLSILDLVQHFTKPHSQQDTEHQQSVEASGVKESLELDVAMEGGGGQLDSHESRKVMAEWTTEKSTPAPTAQKDKPDSRSNNSNRPNKISNKAKNDRNNNKNRRGKGNSKGG